MRRPNGRQESVRARERLHALVSKCSARSRVTVALEVVTAGQTPREGNDVESVTPSTQLRHHPVEHPPRAHRRRCSRAHSAERRLRDVQAGAIGFHDVTVRYDGAAVNALSHVSFQLAHAAVCGVVGRTGSGKSTLAKALFRVVVPEKGHITLVRLPSSQGGLGVKLTLLLGLFYGQAARHPGAVRRQ